MSLGAAVIMRVYLYDVELRDRYTPVPYIPIAKCMTIRYPEDIRRGLCFDNGRILQADFLEMCITDIDYRIIVQQYKCRIEVQEMYTAWYDYLPRPIRELNIEYFKKKTDLPVFLDKNSVLLAITDAKLRNSKFNNSLFIFASLFNCFNCRTDRLRLFSGLSENRAFIFIMLLVCGVQILFTYVGGSILRTAPLLPSELFFTMILSLSVFPIDFLRKLVRKISGKHEGF